MARNYLFARQSLWFISSFESLPFHFAPFVLFFVLLPDAVFDEKNTSFDVSLEMFHRLVASASHIIPEKPWTYDHGGRDFSGWRPSPGAFSG